MDEITMPYDVRSGALTFEEFYELEYPRVYRAAWLLARNEEDASEAAQEAFGRAFARWKRLRDKDWAAGWVITTALNILRKGWKKRNDPAPPAGAVESPSSDAVDLQRALKLLPPRQREAIVLFYVGDLTIHSVADLMGLSDGTVKAHLSQGRAALRRSLEVHHV